MPWPKRAPKGGTRDGREWYDLNEERDPFGNAATRILVPGGRIAMSADFEIEDPGRPDDQAPEARQVPVRELPDEILTFLLGSRYCDTDKLSPTAWNLFGGTPEGWARVQAIVDDAHGRLTGSLRVVGEWATRRRRSERAPEGAPSKVPSARILSG